MAPNALDLSPRPVGVPSLRWSWQSAPWAPPWLRAAEDVVCAGVPPRRSRPRLGAPAWGVLVGLSLGGCHPTIFEYDIEFMLVSDVPSRNPAANIMNPVRTATELGFGANDDGSIPTCANAATPEEAITQVRLLSWTVGGVFGGALSGVQYTRNGVQPGMSLVDAVTVSVTTGDCDGGGQVGAGTLPAGTVVAAIPAGLEGGQADYRPQGDEVLFSWSAPDDADDFEEAVLGDNDLAAGGWDFGLDAQACHSAAFHEDAPGSGESETDEGSLLMVHVVRFRVEGEGHPCSPDDSEDGA